MSGCPSGPGATLTLESFPGRFLVGLRSRAPEEASNGYTATRLRMAEINSYKLADGTVSLSYTSISLALLLAKGDPSSLLFTEVKPCWMKLISG